MFVTVFWSWCLRVASVSCQVSSSLPSKVKYFPGLNSSQFGTWDRGREGVNLIPVRGLAFSHLSLQLMELQRFLPSGWDMWSAAAK